MSKDKKQSSPTPTPPPKSEVEIKVAPKKKPKKKKSKPKHVMTDNSNVKSPLSKNAVVAGPYVDLDPSIRVDQGNVTYAKDCFDVAIKAINCITHDDWDKAIDDGDVPTNKCVNEFNFEIPSSIEYDGNQYFDRRGEFMGGMETNIKISNTSKSAITIHMVQPFAPNSAPEARTNNVVSPAISIAPGKSFTKRTTRKEIGKLSQFELTEQERELARPVEIEGKTVTVNRRHKTIASVVVCIPKINEQTGNEFSPDEEVVSLSVTYKYSADTSRTSGSGIVDRSSFVGTAHQDVSEMVTADTLSEEGGIVVVGQEQRVKHLSCPRHAKIVKGSTGDYVVAIGGGQWNPGPQYENEETVIEIPSYIRWEFFQSATTVNARMKYDLKLWYRWDKTKKIFRLFEQGSDKLTKPYLGISVDSDKESYVLSASGFRKAFEVPGTFGRGFEAYVEISGAPCMVFIDSFRGPSSGIHQDYWMKYRAERALAGEGFIDAFHQIITGIYTITKVAVKIAALI